MSYPIVLYSNRFADEEYDLLIETMYKLDISINLLYEHLDNLLTDKICEFAEMLFGSKFNKLTNIYYVTYLGNKDPNQIKMMIKLYATNFHFFHSDDARRLDLFIGYVNLKENIFSNLVFHDYPDFNRDVKFNPQLNCAEYFPDFYVKIRNFVNSIRINESEKKIYAGNEPVLLHKVIDHMFFNKAYETFGVTPIKCD